MYDNLGQSQQYNEKKSIIKLYMIKNILKLKTDSTQKNSFDIFIY